MQIKVTIKDRREPDTDYDFWKSKSPEERIGAVEFLREQCYLAMGYSEPPAITRLLKSGREQNEGPQGLRGRSEISA